MTYKLPLLASVGLFLLFIFQFVIIVFMMGIEFPMEIEEANLYQVSGIDNEDDGFFESITLEFVNVGVTRAEIISLSISTINFNYNYKTNSSTNVFPIEIRPGRVETISFEDPTQKEMIDVNQTLTIITEFKYPDSSIVNHTYSVTNFQIENLNSSRYQEETLFPLFKDITVLILAFLSFFPLIEYLIRRKNDLINFKLKRSMWVAFILMQVFNLVLMYLFLND